MSDGRYKRFVFLIIFVIILLSVVIGLLFAILNKSKDVQIQYYKGVDGRDGQSIVGPVGPQGASVVGPAGKDGINAETVITNIVTNVPVPGEPGPQGPTGNDARQIVLRVEATTCLLQSQYFGDDGWTTLAQLPKPCAEGGND